MTIENVREYKFDPKKVIEGLNGYYESDKRNGYITVYRYVGGPAYLGADVWLSALIEWLRVDHDIFYRPGLIFDQVEAARSAAKMCCLRAHIKDEISKRGLWCTAEEDIPELVDTLFKAYDECAKARDRNRKDAVKLSEVTRELRKELNALKDTVSKVRSRLNKKFCNDEYEDDLEKLAVIAVNAVEIRDATINNINVIRPYVLAHLKKTLQSRSISFDKKDEKDILKLIDLLALDHDKAWGMKFDLCEENQKLKKTQKSDINGLIRDYCVKYNVVAPSRYLSDEACVEYLFSVINLKQKDHSFAIVQDLYRDIFKRQPDGLSAEDIANKILDKVLETEDLLHKSVDSVCDHSNIALRDIYTTVASPVERLRYNIDDCDGAIVDHMKEYILRRFEGLRANTEYCLKKMSELDGCQKDLKTLEEQRDEFMKQNAKLAIKIDAKDDEINRLKDLINAMNEEVKDM